MYQRKIESRLIEWKNTPNHKPLVIKGCRQCGKTSSVLDFARKNYKNVVYMDFREEKDLISIFDSSLNIDYLTTMISSSLPGTHFTPHQTCIIFDEIQDCPRARTSLKYFHLDGRYDIICTGSLLGVSGYRNPDVNNAQDIASIPVGFETIIDMNPMDFEEWLWTNGINQPAIQILKDSLENEIPVPKALHERMRRLLLEYAVVGGMPEAVTVFHQTHDMNKVVSKQRDIVNEYKDDMMKYASKSDKSKIRECFESIPRQLSKENKKFTYSTVKKGARSSQYLGALQWIEDAGIIRRCYNLSITELPLSGNAIQDIFKVYMADTGLFISMLDDGTQGDILRGNLYGYKGAIFENLMADILGKMERKLYYFQKNDSIELDFVIRYKGLCTPIECKARTGNAKSMRTVLNHPEKYHVVNALKFGDYNVGRDGQLLTLPFYMAFLVTEI